MPYFKGFSESCKNIWSKHGIKMHFKWDKNTRDLLVTPNGKDTIFQMSRVIYWYKCGSVDCENEYIGESGRNFAERFKDHLKALSPIYDHFNRAGQTTTVDNFTIVGREEQNLGISVIFIRQWLIPEKEQRQIPAAKHMGWHSGELVRT